MGLQLNPDSAIRSTFAIFKAKNNDWGGMIAKMKRNLNLRKDQNLMNGYCDGFNMEKGGKDNL